MASYGPSSPGRTITRASLEFPAAYAATARMLCRVPALSAAVLQRIA